MKFVKTIGWLLLLIFIIIQFIQPKHNTTTLMEAGDFIMRYHPPASVEKAFRNACYDCHSNHTHYPWYSNIQPAGWVMADHIKDGKAELNFSEFGSYPKRRQLSKLTGIINSLKSGSMPLKSYTWFHKNARLSKEEKTTVWAWVAKMEDSIQ